MLFEELHTERMILRKLTPEVYDFIFSNYSEAELLDFFQSAQELEQERKRHTKGMTTFNRSFVSFFLLDKSKRILIGSAGFHTWAFEHFRAEIGYALSREEYKNKGYMSEALTAILDYGFNTMQLRRVEAFIGPDNIASQKLATKFGFKYEGNLREHYLKNGKLEDSWAYGLLKREYEDLEIS